MRITEKKANTKLNQGLEKRDKAVYYLLIAPPFILLFLVTAGPLLYSIFYIGLLHWNLSMPDLKRFIGLGNYLKIARDSDFWFGVLRSCYQVFGTVIPQLLIGILMALLLARKFKGIGFLRSIYMVGMMTTPIVTALAWRMMYNTEMGILNYFLSLVGITGPDWLGNPILAMPSVIMADLWRSTPFVTMIILAGLVSLPQELYDAIKVDGAKNFQIFWHLTLPLLRPYIALAAIFRIMDGFKGFDTIYVLTAGGPGSVTETLNIYAFLQGFRYYNTGYAAALSTVMLIIIFLLCVFFINLLQRTENA